MIRKLAVLSSAVAVACAFSLASVPAHSVPLAPLKADSNITLVGKGDGDKNWSKKGGSKQWSGSKHDGDKNWNNKGGSKKWSGSKHHGNKNWSKKGGSNKWSGKGRGGKKWSNRGNWYAGQRHRGHWRNGVFITLPFVIGDQCYDYLDWRDGAPRPGWYWVC
jgi:hypothetical protein